ncbi:MAG: system fructose subfamily component [Bacillota bacterium]|jgi:mannose/fructose/sorbose-specific phosphotransferase system IIA component|nr:system fructose subfamily component [Bacillota bacterium]
MVNILIVTHGDFGKELLRSSEIIIGKIDGAKSISFNLGESFETLAKEVSDTIEKFSSEELIVFTDMYGGSPFNAVQRALKNNNFYHITGVNFPLFIDIAVNKNAYSLDEIAEKIIKNGKKSIVFVNEKFSTD